MLYFKHASQVDPRSDGQQLTQKSYKKVLTIQKENGQPYYFCGQLTMSYRDIVCTSFMLES